MFLKIRRLVALYIDFILIFMISYFPFHYIYTMFYTSFMNLFMGAISILLFINLFLRKDCLVGYESIGKKIMLLTIYQEKDKIKDKKLLIDRVAYTVWPFISYPFMILYKNKSKGDEKFNTYIVSKNNKKNIIPTIIIILIILLTFFWPLLSNLYNSYKANKLVSIYNLEESQLKYFDKNKKTLENMIKILDENKIITKISISGGCDSGNCKYIYDDIVICSKSHNIKIPELDIMRNFKKLKIFSITLYDHDNIEFNIVKTKKVKISFNYCADIKNCNMIKDGNSNVVHKTVINDNWSSYYIKTID